MKRHGKWVLRVPLLVVLGLCTALVIGAGSAAASSYTCTNSSADQAALQALINAGGTITITGTCRGDWTVSAANVKLQAGGPGATLNGNAAGTVLFVTNGRTATVTGMTIVNASNTGVWAQGGGTVVNIQSSTLRGNSGGNGGAILSQSGATANVTGSTITGNSAAFGGGACTFSTLNVTNSTFSGNSASEGGGAICAAFATVSVTSSRLVSNTAFDGGAIVNFGGGGGVTVTGSSIDHNSLSSIDGGGGAIANFSSAGDAPVTLVGTTLSSNFVPGGRGGAIFNEGNNNNTASITASGGTVFSGNQATGGGSIPAEGGAIYTEANGGIGLVTLTDTTIGESLNGNRAQYGGGIYNDAFNGLTMVTLGNGAHVVANTASVTGGGIDNAGGVVSVGVGAVLLGNHPNNCTGC